MTRRSTRKRCARSATAPSATCASVRASPRVSYLVRNSAPARQYVGVDDVAWLAALVGDDLVEDVGELQLPLVARDVAEVRRADDVVHREQRMLAAEHRLVLVDVDPRLARTPRL